MHTPRFRRSSSMIMALLLVLVASSAAAARTPRTGTHRTPVVIFPAFHFTKLKVEVNQQTVAPECPQAGSFQDWFLNDHPSNGFSQVCKDKLLTLVYDPNPARPMAERFSNQPGVTVELLHYGKTQSAPFYETLYTTLEAAGYERNQNIRVAGYDARLTPDMGGFLERTIALIEQTYAQNQNTPVHLVAHSNGPLYAQYLLTHTSQAWKNTYIHGFTALAGNWPGQGLLYPVFFTGLNINSAGFVFPTDQDNAASSATMYQSHPSSYMSAADPAIFGDQEVVVEDLTSGKAYTPQDNIELFQDAGLSQAAALAAYYTGFVKFADPASFPNVDVYAEKGSGLPTIVGLKLQSLSTGQVADFSDANIVWGVGDGNQEDITNDAIQVWENMDCFRFELTDNDKVDHFMLASDEAVLQRLLTNLQRVRSAC